MLKATYRCIPLALSSYFVSLHVFGETYCFMKCRNIGQLDIDPSHLKVHKIFFGYIPSLYCIANVLHVRVRRSLAINNTLMYELSAKAFT